MSNKTVHFSIDDVGSVFREICTKKIDDIYELPLFGNLLKMNEQYGLRASIYIFEPTSFFMAMKKSAITREFFEKASDWISVGFHGNKVPFKKDYEYAAEWFLVDNICDQYNIIKSNSLRLHNWYATEEQKQFLKKHGICTLFYPDDDCFRYNENDEFYLDDLLYKRTNVRIEALDKLNDESLYIGEKNDIVVFTHEICFATEAIKIDKTIAKYYEAGYTFVLK